MGKRKGLKRRGVTSVAVRVPPIANAIISVSKRDQNNAPTRQRTLAATPAPRLRPCMHTRFHSIAAQVAASLREEIGNGNGRALASERELTQRLQVSRRTVRKALAILRTEGLVKTVGRRTLPAPAARRKSTANQPAQINLLLPEPLVRARPFTALWISQLTELLHANGCRLGVITGHKYYGLRSGRSLAKLVATHPARCWILARSNLPLQQWFNDRGIPAIVAGSTYPGIILPSVDTDHAALSRHAAAHFQRQGHTRLALFLEKILHAGDIETELGFKAGLADWKQAVEPLICRVERTPEAVVRELKRLLALRHPPTGFLLCNSFSYLTVLSYLAAQGRRIPQDFSLISQDEGPFLAHVYPNPARYLTNPTKFASALNRAVKRLLDNDLPREFKIRIMPDFIAGASVAPPPGE